VDRVSLAEVDFHIDLWDGVFEGPGAVGAAFDLCEDRLRGGRPAGGGGPPVL